MQPQPLPKALMIGFIALAVSTLARAETPPVVAIPALESSIDLDGKDTDDA